MTQWGANLDKKILFIISILIIICACLGSWFFALKAHTFSGPPIKVGILHSLTGTMAISERSVADATLIAIDEINENGGILGRPIKPILVDGRSDWNYSAKMAEKLITEDKVSVIFGCWTSACRKTLKPILEKYNSLMFYPVQYEGLEQSPNIVYTGAAPNQQIIPAVKWSIDHLGKRFFLIGSDYVFPRTENEIIKEQIKILGGVIVGEDYITLGSQNVEPIIQKIIQVKPDVILNTINGDSNIAFFKALQAAEISSSKIPVMSLSIGETELSNMDKRTVVGNYATWNYFQSIPTPENNNFVERFKQKYGSQRVIDDPMEAAYFGVYLWAQAVQDANTADAEKVQQTIKKQSFYAPEGNVYVDPETLHTWRSVKIGKIRDDGQFDIVWSSERSVEPVPFPAYRSKSEWELFLQNLYRSWNEHWENPKRN